MRKTYRIRKQRRKKLGSSFRMQIDRRQGEKFPL